MDDHFETALFGLIDDSLRDCEHGRGATERADALLDLRLRVHELVTLERLTQDCVPPPRAKRGHRNSFVPS